MKTPHTLHGTSGFTTVPASSLTRAKLILAKPTLSYCEAYASHVSKDRKSTRLNSSHVAISYAVFCMKKIMLLLPGDLIDALFGDKQVSKAAREELEPQYHLHY